MKITSIVQQIRRLDRYSIFVDGKYTFSLSESALLESKLVKGQALTSEQVKQLKKLSADDKLYGQSLRYVALRPRTKWEMQTYLERKNASPALIEKLLNKLSNADLLDDEKFAKTFVENRRLLRSASRRKIDTDLRKKHVPKEFIESALGSDPNSERDAIIKVIEKKRRQSKYQDELKIMQYLARQGFNYGDIKAALASISEKLK